MTKNTKTISDLLDGDRPRTTSRHTRAAGWRWCAVALVGVVSACGAPAVEQSSAAPIDTPAPTAAPVNSTVPTPSTIGPGPTQTELLQNIPMNSVIDMGENPPQNEWDPITTLTIADLQAWWPTEFPKIFNRDYPPLEAGVWASYPGRVSPLPTCFGHEMTPEVVERGYALYCPSDDFIAFSDGPESGLSDLARKAGPAAVGIALAHEWGHAIAARSSNFDRDSPTIVGEQIADCYAGAWVRRAYNGESPFLRLGDNDLRTALVALIEIRDPVGSDQLAEGGHGAAFDRIGAFQEGFETGSQRCAAIPDDPLPLVPNQFQTAADTQNEGNAPYSCAELPIDKREYCIPGPRFLGDDLNEFWKARDPNFPELVGVPVAAISPDACPDGTMIDQNILLCPSLHEVIYNEAAILALYRDYGDFALGYYYAIAWAEEALQVKNVQVQGEQRALFRDCLTGLWVADITPDADGNTPRNKAGGTSTVSSSPGDLDEAVQMAVLLGDEGTETNLNGSPFEKIDALREGAISANCNSYAS